MKKPLSAYAAPSFEVSDINLEQPIATSASIDNYNEVDFNWGE